MLSRASILPKCSSVRPTTICADAGSQVEIEREGLGAGGLDLRSRIVQVLKVSRNKHDR
jgi:hypothetical protein